jgi:UrcA family protein
MANKTLATGVIPAALLIALAAGPVIAQTKSTELDTVTVVAPRITYHAKREAGSVVPKEITVAEKKAQVSYSDLDLTKTADLYALEDRIGKAAARVCDELAQEFPEGEPSAAVCARRATDDAMAQMRQMSRAAVASKP